MRNHRRITTNLKTKQPELPENLAVWKSNNQGFKEETFIQTGRRDGDGQLRQRGHRARQRLADWAGKAVVGGPGMSHIHVPINKEEQLRIETLCNPGFQHREIKPQNLWL